MTVNPLTLDPADRGHCSPTNRIPHMRGGES